MYQDLLENGRCDFTLAKEAADIIQNYGDWLLWSINFLEPKIL